LLSCLVRRAPLNYQKNGLIQADPVIEGMNQVYAEVQLPCSGSWD
jgi:hypothetical protein